MACLSVLDPRGWDQTLIAAQPEYRAGHALGWLYRGNKQASTAHLLTGRLYLSKSGWLLLSVPNALIRGVFDALSAPGAELPTAGVMNVPDVKSELVNAHISVMTPAEVAAIGETNINERGHMYGYALGGLYEINVKNVDGVSKIWALKVTSPALTAIRKSYGLSPRPNNQDDFHITVAVRRKNVLTNSAVSKLADPIERGERKVAAAHATTYDCCCAGPCTCPATCICKKSGYCGQKKEAAVQVKAAAGLQTVNNLMRSFRAHPAAQLVTRSPASNLINRLPPGPQSVVRNSQRLLQYGTAGAAGYGGYRHVQNIAGDAATHAAGLAGVNDQSTLQEVRARAQRSAFPMLYRSVAPSYLGGDNTPLGRSLASSVGTAARHNMRLKTFMPSKKNNTASFFTQHPVMTAAKQILPGRATATELLRNIPSKDQLSAGYNVGRALLDRNTMSPLARSVQNIFEPAINYKKNQLMSAVGLGKQ